MSKLLNKFITREHLPLKKFKHDVIEILFADSELSTAQRVLDGEQCIDLTDEEIFAKLRILKRTYEDVLKGKKVEGKKDMTHWALQNIS